MQFGPMFLGKGHVGEYVFLGLIHHCRQLPDFGAELIGNLPPLLTGHLGGVLSKGGGDEGGDDAATALAGMGQDVAHEMHLAALPCGAENLGYSGFDALVGVGNDQFDAFQAAVLELAQGVDPQIRPFTFDRAVEEGLDSVVDVGAQLADLAFRDPGPTHGLHQIVHGAGRDALNIGFLDHGGQRLFRQPARLKEAGKVAAGSQLGNAQRLRPRP